MSFGLRTWSPAGAVELDTDSFTYQVIHNITYKLEDSQVLSVPIPGFDPSTCVATILPMGAKPSDDIGVTGAIPYVEASAGKVTIYSKHPGEAGRGISTRLQFRLLVMRFRQ